MWVPTLLVAWIEEEGVKEMLMGEVFYFFAEKHPVYTIDLPL